MKTKEQIEESLGTPHTQEQLDKMSEREQEFIAGFNMGCMKGAEWMQKDLLSEASEGFEEFLQSQSASFKHVCFCYPDVANEIWQASQLSMMKRLEEAERVIGFYGDKKNWTIDGHDYETEIANAAEWDEWLTSIRFADTSNGRVAGSRAREYMAKYGDKK